MQEVQLRSRPILILGVDRSGTSLMGELLALWGANAGAAQELPAPDEGNPQGYWEYKPMQDFVAELIASVGVSVWDPAFRPLMRDQARDDALRSKALALAAAMEQPERISWFWKEPEIIFTLPFWSVVLSDPIYVITLRNPYHSALSYQKFLLPPALRDKVQLIGYFLMRWQYFMISIFEELKDYKSKLLVSYEALVASPREQCARIDRFLAVECGSPAGDGAAGRMAQAINPSLCRNRGGPAFFESDSATAAQKELFSYLASRIDGEVGDFDPSRYPMPDVWREYFSNISVMRWLFDAL